MRKPEIGERWKYEGGFEGRVQKETCSDKGRSTWKIGNPSSNYPFYIHEEDLSHWKFVAPAIKPGQVWKQNGVFATVILKGEEGLWHATAFHPVTGTSTVTCIPEDDCAWEFVADPAQLGDQYLLEGTVWTVVGLSSGWITMSASSGSRRDLRYGDLVQHGQRLPVAPQPPPEVALLGKLFKKAFEHRVYTLTSVKNGRYTLTYDLAGMSATCTVPEEAFLSEYKQCPDIELGQCWDSIYGDRGNSVGFLAEKQADRWILRVEDSTISHTTEQLLRGKLLTPAAKKGQQYLIEEYSCLVREVDLTKGLVRFNVIGRNATRNVPIQQMGQYAPIPCPEMQVGQVWQYWGAGTPVECVAVEQHLHTKEWFLNCTNSSVFSVKTHDPRWKEQWTFVRDFVASKGDQYQSFKNRECTVKDIDLVRKVVILTGSFGQEAVPFETFLSAYGPTSKPEPVSEPTPPAKPSHTDLLKAIEAEMETPPKGVCRAAWVSFLSECAEPSQVAKRPDYTPEAVQALASAERLAPSLELQFLHQKHSTRSKNWWE